MGFNKHYKEMYVSCLVPLHSSPSTLAPENP